METLPAVAHRRFLEMTPSNCGGVRSPEQTATSCGSLTSWITQRSCWRVSDTFYLQVIHLFNKYPWRCSQGSRSWTLDIVGRALLEDSPNFRINRPKRKLIGLTSYDLEPAVLKMHMRTFKFLGLSQDCILLTHTHYIYSYIIYICTYICM